MLNQFQPGIGIYMRLSRDDDKAGESMSIEHQRIILQSYANEHDLPIAEEYVDDGYSGTDFNRPAVKRLLDDAKEGRISTILVKDLSRFGRNYIQVGQYLDYIFPAYGVRFIALNDNIDTADRSSTAMDMMPIMNVFNEWHAANTSRKIRAVFEASMRAGRYISWRYPYGYKAGNDDKRTAVIDEEAAKVVRRIYDLRLQGASFRAIAKTLSDEGIPNPATYYTKTDGSKWNRHCGALWSARTVAWILTNPTYLGRTIQHKTTGVSYKNHQIIRIPESDWIIKEGAHAPIISREIWEKVRTVNRSAPRGRADQRKRTHALSGFLICPDCGNKFKLQRSGKGEYGFVCRTYKDLGNRHCTSHYISEKQIEAVVLGDIRALLTLPEFDEAKVKERFLRAREKASGRSAVEVALKAQKARLAELEQLIRAAFEEKVLNGMPEAVCQSLCETYLEEKKSVSERIEALEAVGSDETDAGTYLEKLKRYRRCESLTREMCLQLLDHITVGGRQEAEREIHIHYRCAAPTVSDPGGITGEPI